MKDVSFWLFWKAKIMNRAKKKGIVISELVEKSRNALKEGFYLEAVFLIHVIIEERLRSTLLKVNPNLGGRNKIPGCIKKIKQYKTERSHLFHLHFSDSLLKEIQIWKKSKRDKLIHDIDNNYELINDFERLKVIANEGDRLMKTLNADVMRWKKRHQSL